MAEACLGEMESEAEVEGIIQRAASEVAEAAAEQRGGDGGEGDLTIEIQVRKEECSTWVPIHLCEMFPALCFGTMNTDRVQNKTYETSHTSGWEASYSAGLKWVPGCDNKLRQKW